MTQSKSSPNENDPSAGNPHQGLRIFFSFDLTGSSSFKYRYPPVASGDTRSYKAWPAVFTEFFTQTNDTFRANVRTLCERFDTPFYTIRMWKILGDEILFYSFLETAEQAYWLGRAFFVTIRQIEEYMADYGMSVKGYCWTAGFPIRNRQVNIDTLFQRVSSVAEEFADDSQSAYAESIRELSANTVDFIGTEIDQGFRLGSIAEPGRLSISPDAAYVCAIGKSEAQAGVSEHSNVVASAQMPYRVFHVGWRKLKGVYRDLPYPVLWLEYLHRADPRVERRTFDIVDSDFTRAYLTSATQFSSDDYVQYFLRYSRDLNGSGIEHIVPYIQPRSMPLQDRALYPTISGSLHIDTR